MWARLGNIALGIWLMAAPAVLGYGGVAADNDRVVGPLVASFATIAIWEATRGLRRLNLLLGLWLLAAPWVLGYGSAAALNSIVVGITIAALSLWRGRVKQRLGGGWRALWSPERAREGRDNGMG